MNTAPKSSKPEPIKPSRPLRPLALLAILVIAIFASLGIGTKTSDASWAPKLALDLEGGTQLILTPKTTDGSQITPEDIDEAIAIIRQRVDASGVAEAEITRQGQQNIVVGLPGTPSDETLDLVRQSALMRFRPVLEIGNPGVVTEEQLKSTQGEDIEGADDPYLAAADQDKDGKLSEEPATDPANNSDPAWVTEKVLYDFLKLDCTDPANLTGGATHPADKPIVACDPEGSAKFILGPTDVEGTQISSAQGRPHSNGQVLTGDYEVGLEFKSEGTKQFAETSQRLVSLPPPRNQFAMVLDGLVISAPRMQSAILDGKASITGGFTQEQSFALAKQLAFGSLPLNFEVQSEEQISATLGTEQLERGILAGVIGLGLVMIYMIFTYRGLSVITMASLLMAAILSYGTIALLSWTQGYRLSLPGVAGLIVAIGITADSFIVYFERVRDEVREGADLQTAVSRGWKRARRTILASDAVNFLAAIVLYFLAVGGVRGFAFTLGLTTLVDLLVVFWFTHPLLELLVKTRFFGGGHKWSGLDPTHLGATPVYRGRGRGIEAPTPKKAKVAAPVKGSSTLTIAERRAAERRAQREAAEEESK